MIDFMLYILLSQKIDEQIVWKLFYDLPLIVIFLVVKKKNTMFLFSTWILVKEVKMMQTRDIGVFLFLLAKSQYLESILTCCES